MRLRGVRKGRVLLGSLLVPLLAAGVLISLLPAQGEAMGWRPAWPPWKPAPGNLAVTVTSAGTNSALSGAQVTVAGRTMTTDQSGRAIFGSLAPGQYTANATAAGHQPGGAQATVNPGQTTSVGIRLAPIPPPPPPPPPIGKGSLTVTVVGAPQNIPLANSQVRIETSIVVRPGTPAQLVTKTATTGPNGQAQFQNLPPGQYKITATHAAYRQGTGMASVGTGPTRATVRLLPGSGPVGPTAKTGDLYVNVYREPSRAPVSDATVRITGTVPRTAPGPGGPTETISRSASTRRDGKAIFLNIPEGSYQVQVTRSGYRPWTGTARVQRGQNSVTATLTPVAGPGGPTATSGNLTVVVTSDKGKPITNAQVSIQGTNPTTAKVSARQVTGPDGTARFLRIPQGAYRVNATAPGHQPGVLVGNVGGNSTFRLVLRSAP
jgi:hypothetical protein